MKDPEKHSFFGSFSVPYKSKTGRNTAEKPKIILVPAILF